MSRNSYAAGKKALGICDRCGWSWLLSKLKTERVNETIVNNLVCPYCLDPDQPQNRAGRIDYSDPIGLRNPRPDISTGAIDDLSYEFLTDLDGWTHVQGPGTTVWTTGGYLTHTTSLPNDTIGAGLPGTELGLDASLYNRAHVKCLHPGGAIDRESWRGSFYFIKQGDNLSEFWGLSTAFPIVSTFGDKWFILEYSLAPHAFWTGTIGSIQFAPFKTGSGSSNTLYIDYIRLMK